MTPAAKVPLHAIHGTAKNDLLIVGARNYKYTWNGAQVFFQTPRTLSSADTIFALGPSSVWAGGAKGALAHYDGTTWKDYTTGLGISLLGLWAASEKAAFAVGTPESTEQFLLTFDGTAWTKQVLPTVTGFKSLSAVTGTGASDVWAVGNTATAYRFNGTSWSTSVTPATDVLVTAYSPAAGEVWAGGKRDLLHFVGNAWTRDTSLGAGIVNISAIHGTAANNVWIATTGGNVWQYDGSKWTERPTGVTASYLAIAVRSASEVLLGGTSGALYSFNGTKATKLRLPFDATSQVSALSSESTTKLWLGTTEGIASHRK